MKTPTLKNSMARLFLFIILLTTDFTVSAQSIPGQLSGGGIVCAGNNNGSLFLSGYTGSVIRWEISNSINGPWTTMNHTQPIYNYSNLTQSLWFRVITQSNNFPEAISNAEEIQCQLPGSPPIIAAPAQLCIGTSGTVSVLSGAAANMTWLYTQNNWQNNSVLSVSNATSILLGSLTPPYELRLLTTDGACPTLSSNIQVVAAAQQTSPGVIVGPTLACSASNASTLVITGKSGQVNHWEVATSPSGPYSPISGSSGLSALPNANLFQTSYFRAQIQNSGCQALYTPVHTFVIQAPSVGGFVVGTSSVCNGVNTASFYLLGNTGTILQWQYTINGGNSWQSASGTSTILTVGNRQSTSVYRVLVQNGSCSSAYSTSHTLTVNNKPFVAFNYSNTCSASLLTFTNQTLNGITHFWDFGDGNYSTLINPSHTFFGAGVYSIKLISTAQSGCIDSSSAQVVCYPLPVPAFVSPASACAENGVQFVSTSTISSGSIVLQSFNFGDGTVPTQNSSPSHSFISEGVKLINLTTISNYGCAQSISKNISIHPKPIAQFQLANSCIGERLKLTDGSFISSGSFAKKWRFGNGDTSMLSAPNYSFEQAGLYFIKLELISDKGCSSSQTKTVLIHPVTTPTLLTENTCAENSTTISAIIPGANSFKKFQLYFGDGGSSTYLLNQHIYNVPGMYLLTYSLESDSGCISDGNKQLIIHPKPSAKFTTNTICTQTPFKPENLSSVPTGSLSYLWSIGTFTSSQKQPEFLISQTGAHALKLSIASEQQCTDSAEILINVNPTPMVAFSIAGKCQYQTLLFQNFSSVSQGKIEKIDWQFGDMTSSSLWQLEKKYERPGTYSVSLTCQSEAKCTAQITKSVQIHPTVRASLTGDLFCEGEKQSLRLTSGLIEETFTTEWQVDQIKKGNGMELSVKNLLPGRHEIQLLTETSSQCRDSTRETIFIYPRPELQVTGDSLIDLGEEIQLTATGAATYSWLPTIQLSTPFSANTHCKPDSSITYVCMGQSEYGCITSKSIRVRVKKNYDLKIYNIVTPDNNGLNDTWQIENISSYPDNKVLLFDQWNNLVFEETNYSNDWAGRNKRGELLPPGTYFYQISFTSSTKIFRGFITLLLTE